MGVAAALSPVPMVLAWILWSWLLFFGIGIRVLNLNSVPDWMQYLMMLPLLISPFRCVHAMIYSAVHHREKRAWLGILLSVAGLAENALLFYGVIYVGSRY